MLQYISSSLFTPNKYLNSDNLSRMNKKDEVTAKYILAADLKEMKYTGLVHFNPTMENGGLLKIEPK